MASDRSVRLGWEHSSLTTRRPCAHVCRDVSESTTDDSGSSALQWAIILEHDSIAQCLSLSHDSCESATPGLTRPASGEIAKIAATGDAGEQLAKEATAATKIQAVGRGTSARREAAAAGERRAAAAAVANAAVSAQEELASKEAAAATKIQAVGRGTSARREAAAAGGRRADSSAAAAATELGGLGLSPPPLPEGFSQREGVLDGLLRGVLEASGAAPVLTVRGQGGIGKTTCAAALLRLHRAALAQRFPDGCFWSVMLCLPYPFAPCDVISLLVF